VRPAEPVLARSPAWRRWARAQHSWPHVSASPNQEVVASKSVAHSHRKFDRSSVVEHSGEARRRRPSWPRRPRGALEARAMDSSGLHHPERT